MDRASSPFNVEKVQQALINYPNFHVLKSEKEQQQIRSKPKVLKKACNEVSYKDFERGCKSFEKLQKCSFPADLPPRQNGPVIEACQSNCQNFLLDSEIDFNESLQKQCEEYNEFDQTGDACTTPTKKVVRDHLIRGVYLTKYICSQLLNCSKNFRKYRKIKEAPLTNYGFGYDKLIQMVIEKLIECMVCGITNEIDHIFEDWAEDVFIEL